MFAVLANLTVHCCTFSKTFKQKFTLFSLKTLNFKNECAIIKSQRHSEIPNVSARQSDALYSAAEYVV